MASHGRPRPSGRWTELPGPRQTRSVSEWCWILTIPEMVRDLLVRAREGGVVLDYALLEHAPPDSAAEVLHREAAIMAVGMWASARGKIPTDVDPARVPGQRVTVDEFYGARFDLEKRRLLPSGTGWGYAEAFASPPYGLRLSLAEAEEIFLGLNDELLASPGEDIEAFRWTSHWDPAGPDVWAPYFEYQWWGCCVWTLRVANRILAIGASASD